MADELRNDQGLAVGDINPESGNPVVAIIAKQSPRLRKEERAQNLQERQFAFHQLDADRARTLNEHQSALSEVNNYYNLAKELAGQETEMQRKIDAANFLSEAKSLKPGATFEQDVAKLHAAYPHAAGDEAVKEWHSVMLPAQNNFNEASRAAGNLQNEAQVKGVIPGETMTRNLIGQGLLTDENLTYGSQNHIYNPDGTVNHEKAANIAAYNQNQGLRKDTAQEAQDLRLIEAYRKQTGFDPKDPEFASSEEAPVYFGAVRRQAAREKARNNDVMPGPQGAAKKSASAYIVP